MREISIITLGVRNLETSATFYESLGFVRSRKSDENIVWFRTGSTVLALYPWASLADDVGKAPGTSGFRGVTMALNMRSREEVDSMVEVAERAGARIIKSPKDVFWGGYSSYFEDPDGHLWEVAWNPFTDVEMNGRLIIEG